MFYGCKGLKSVIINSSAVIASIGINAFYDCTSFEVLKTSSDTTTDFKVKIPKDVTSIGGGAFQNCINIQSMKISGNVTSIGNSTFTGCTGLKALKLDDGTSTLSLGINSFSSSGIGRGLFRDCPLESLYVGRKLDYASYKYSSTTYYYSSNQQYFGYSAFANITTLATVTISVPVSAGATSFTIGKYAFEGCTGITSATFDPNTGWTKATSSTATQESVVVSTPASAATVLKNMGENYLYWKKQ